MTTRNPKHATRNLQLATLLCVFFFSSAMSQTQYVEIDMFRAGGKAPMEGATVYLVPVHLTYPSGSLLMTAHTIRVGTYYRNAVPAGTYNVWVNQAKYNVALPVVSGYIKYRDSLSVGGSGSTVSHNYYGFAADEVTTTLNEVDSTISVKDDGISTAKLADGNVTNEKIAYSAAPTGTAYQHFHAGTDWNRATARTARSSYLNYKTTNDLGGGSYPTNLAFIGNSIMSQFRLSFMFYAKANFGLVGLGFDPLDNPGYGSYAPITKSSTWTGYELDGGEAFQSPGGSALVGTTGDTLKYGPISIVRFTDIRIWYLKTSGGGTFDYHIDGGAGATINTTAGSNALGCVRISGLSGNTDHYVTIKSITGTVTLFAIETFSAKMGGLVPYWFCEGGTTSNMWTGNLSFFRAIYDTVNPAVTNIELGPNDAGTLFYTAAAYKGYMNKIIDTVRAVDSCAIVLWTNYPREDYSTPGQEDAAYTTLSDEYRDTLFSIGATKGLSVFDVRKIWPPTWAEAHNADLYLDQIHPNGNGGTVLAQNFFNFLSLADRNYVAETSKPFFDFGLSVRPGSAASPAISSFGENGVGVRSADPSGFFWQSDGFPAVSLNGEQRVRFGYDGSQNYLMSFFTTSTFRGVSFSRRGNSVLAWAMSTDAGDEPEFDSNNAAWHIKRSGTEMMKIGELGTPPASASATGTTGQVVFGTDGYVYVCTATNTWVRVQLATW